MKKKTGAALVALTVTLGGASACDPNASNRRERPVEAPAPPVAAGGNPEGTKNPNPRQGDPQPHTTDTRPDVPVTVTCIWTGRRYMAITVRLGSSDIFTNPNFKYTSDGISSKPETGGGTFTKTVSAKPGQEIGILCTPLVEAGGVKGFLQCSVKNFGTILPPAGYQHVQSGPVACSGVAPK